MELLPFVLLGALLTGLQVSPTWCSGTDSQEGLPEDDFQTHVSETEVVNKNLAPKTCLQQHFSRVSCQKVICPPWMRCSNGHCECKLPYQCLRDNATAVCGIDGCSYTSYCKLKALDCRRGTALFSHFGSDCEGASFEVDLKGQQDVVEIVRQKEALLVCGTDWDIQAANVACRQARKALRGAEQAAVVKYKTLQQQNVTVSKCASVKCSGLEWSLAECVFSKERMVNAEDTVAAVKCSLAHRECTTSEFTCANKKCVPLQHACDSLDHCGDGSDEMCCKACSSGFHCSSNICIPESSVGDGIVDCLGGEDERKPKLHNVSEHVVTTAKNEIKIARHLLEKLECGMHNESQQSEALQTRRKRVIGGHEAEKNQFPWQVGIQEGDSIDCGGTYIGGCWVLTAAHCLRNKPQAFKVKLSLWSKIRRESTTDIVPVQKIFIHENFNPSTYQNDIALIELQKLPFSEECFHKNTAVAPACVPWSTYQFQPGDICRVSGWGRVEAGKTAEILQWADISLIANCSGLYGSRYFDGMECAGSLDGKVDSCQGDSGGPLVCIDKSGVSYVWGIVSWGEKCAVAGQPGVYTKVAHYFDWIALHTGRQAISKYNV